MSLILRCPLCETEILIRRRHRGTDVACPQNGCKGAVEVPLEFDSPARVRGLLQDRKRAGGLTVVALASCVLWFPLVPVSVWFLAARRMSRAREENRAVALELYTARTTAIVATIAQLLCYAAHFAHGRYGVGFEPFMS